MMLATHSLTRLQTLVASSYSSAVELHLVSKLENVAKKGARVALIYNNGGSPNAITGGVIPSAMISAEDGAYLLQKFNAGQPPKISFPQEGGAGSISAPTGGLVSTFSTYGPTFDAYLKPALGAPGGGIISTFPVSWVAGLFLSGTSMATPYMAGVSALLLAHKGRNPDVALAARDILQSTANIIPSSKDDGALYQTASQQGAGLVDAFKALTYTTVVAPGQLLLNDTAYFNGKQTFTVTNGGQKAVTYKLSHTPAGTAHTLDQ
jgi:subtilisin family serine protease